jgi:hypothetical protein
MSFASDMQKMAKKVGGSFDDTVRSSIMQVFSLAIEGTPVDTGRAKGNWQCTLDSPAEGVLDVEDKAGNATIQKMKAVAQNAPGKVCFLTNNLPYIRRLEYGHSKLQAPNGWVRLTVQEFQTKLKEFIK